METEKKPIRILHVLGTTNLGGAESRIMDIYRQIDKTRVQFDFAVHTSAVGFFDEEIQRLGGNIYQLPSFRLWNFFSYRKAWETFFNVHKEFRAVHGHMTSTASIYLMVAKKAGISLVIAHARSAGVDAGIKGKITKWLRRNLAKKADIRLACSKEAGEAVFGKKAMELKTVQIIPNAINAKEFRFNEEKRQKMREHLAIENQFVVGHVGSFRYAKNHEYLLKIFKEFLELEKNAVLMLLGEGELLESVKQQAHGLGIEKKVLFLGNRIPVGDYYQAMDFFVFPSRYEGLPGSVVEAQAAGLKCLVSKNVTREVKCTDLVVFRDIDDEPKAWAEHIYQNENYSRENTIQILQQQGFDTKGQIALYYDIYGIESQGV